MADLRLLIEVLTKGQGDLKGLNRDLKKTGEEAEKTGSKLGNMGKAIGAFAAGFAAVQVVDFLGDATNAAAEFNDTMSATGVIIGEEALPGLEKWAEGAADAFGASKQDALEAANTFGVFGKSAGLAGEDLVGFSTDLTELAGDLASFRGGTTAEAIEAIGSALRGESEPIRRYGVLLDDATLRQRALEEGIVDTTKNALTPQQRVLAAQAEIFAQTADAQGDFARTGEDMANVQRKLQAKLENVTIEIGEKLMPVMLELATWVSDEGIPILNDLVDAMEHVGTVAEGLAGVFRFDFFGGAGPIGDFTDDLTTVTEVLQDAGIAAEEARPLFDKFGDDVGQVRDELERWESAGIAVEDGLAAITDGITETSKSTRDFRVDLQPMEDDAATQSEEVADAMAFEIGLAPGKMADELLANQYVLTGETGAIQQLVDFMEQSLTPAQQMFNAQGFLQSQELADGLVSNNPYVALKAQEMQAAAIDALKLNLFLAMDAGMNLASTYAAGIVNNLGVVRDAGRQLAQGVAGDNRIESEPPNRDSPLYGITKWGYNIASEMAEGMGRGVGLVKSASSVLASAVVPSALQPVTEASGAIPVGALGMGGGLTIILQNHGDPITEDDDVLESLRLLVPHIRDAVAHG